MQRSDGRILTTHAGSLPRPPDLVDLFTRGSKGEAIDPATLERSIEQATRWIVPKQFEAGIDIVNNGEQPREGFFLYLRHRLSGMAPGGKRMFLRDIARYPKYLEMRQRILKTQTAVSNFEVPKVVGAIRYLDRAAVEKECADFRRILDAVTQASPPSSKKPAGEAFVTAPSPGIVAAGIPNEFYDSPRAYLDALAEALRVEYETIVQQGFLLQLDCPDLALERHVSYADRPVAEFVGFVESVVEAINRSLRNIPPERVRLHVCWGNYEGPHDLDVPLADILPAILQAKVGGFVLPFANPRHAHEYRLLAGRLRPEQTLVAGVIDTTTNYIEHPEVVADRIERVAHAVGDPRQVLAGCDCGFDTSAGMGRVAEDIVWAKLASLAEGARIASGRLFK
jgi:5-methyltetrahydropteroyltriglutamate--homocysteine methyltransferase